MALAVSSHKRKHKAVAKKMPEWRLPANFLQTTPLYGDDDEDNRPVLTTVCTLEYFWSLITVHDVKQLSFDHGRVLVEEFPTGTAHGSASHTLVGQLYAVLSPFMYAVGDSSYSPAHMVALQADLAFRPQHIAHPGVGNPGAANPGGAAWPTLIIEVCSKRSLPAGLIKANQWLGPGSGVQIVVLIKLYPLLPTGAAMVALRFERGAANPTWAVSFGGRAVTDRERNRINALGGAQLVGVGVGANPACNAIGLPLYQFHLPTNLLTVGMPAANVPPNAHYDFDLFQLQQATLAKYP